MAKIELERRKLNMVKGPTSHYKLITTHLGRKIAKSYWYWAVSIEGSLYVRIKDIVDSGKLAQEAHEERENKE